MDVPGARKEDLEIRPGPLPGTIEVKVEGKEEERPKTLLRSERGVGDRVRYERLVPVAWDAEVSKAKPSIENGVLTVEIPKQRAEKEPAKK